MPPAMVWKSQFIVLLANYLPQSQHLFKEDIVEALPCFNPDSTYLSPKPGRRTFTGTKSAGRTAGRPSKVLIRVQTPRVGVCASFHPG